MPKALRKKPAKRTISKTPSPKWQVRIRTFIAERRQSLNGYLTRRPHRSFRLTRRRDYVRSLDLPGYWSFTSRVWQTLWRNRKLFSYVVIVYTLLNSIFVGLSSQDSYSQVSQLITESSQGDLGQIGQAGLLVLTGLSGSFLPELSDVQQVYALIFVLLTWLTTIWLLRSLLAGKRPSLRDGVYNAGAPIVPTGIVLIIMTLQLIPMAIVLTVAGVAVSTGFISNGLLATVSWLTVGIFGVITLYWLVSTVMAMVIVTLPGMYPWQAIRTAGDIVIGRRLRIMLRVVWAILLSTIFWIVVVLPAILLDRWVKSLVPSLEWLPIVPLVITIITTFITVWVTAYMYLLYRKVVDDDASPA